MMPRFAPSSSGPHMQTIHDFRALALDLGIEDHFDDDVLAEVRAHEADPRIDDPTLTDWRAVPFVTVDGPGTRDLDQALHLARDGRGYRLRYAIADASFYVAPGSALFREALRRGASFYLPGYSIPMLPRALSEGLVSLGPRVDRRALVFDVRLDAEGTVVDFKLVRARIQSRARLTFEEVDELLGSPGNAALAVHEAADSLALLGIVGALRANHEDRRHMVRYARVEAAVRLTAEGEVEVVREPRGPAELANEQLSILCNALGARWLSEANPEFVQPIYRTHAAPEPERLAAFERLVRKVAAGRGLPDDPWVYRRAAELGLAGYLERLPTTGPDARLARALHRQAMVLNGRSTFASEAASHFGVGEAVYARFTAPMREVVGVFCHKEAIERLQGRGTRPREEDEAIRAQVIEAANRSKDLQRHLGREVDRAVVATVLGADASLPVAERPLRRGTVMGVTTSVVHVALDEPPIDVIVPFREQGAVEGGAWLERADDGARLAVRGGGATICALGDEVMVRAIGEGAVVVVRG